MAADSTIASGNRPAVKTSRARGLTRIEHVWHTIAGVGFAIQAVTGLGSKYIFGEVSDLALFVHMLGAPVFIIGLTAMTLMWADRCRFTNQPPGSSLNLGQKLVFWVAVVLGFAVMLSMLTAMLPVFGYAGQAALIESHEIGATLLLVAMIIHTVVSLAARWAKR
jgi:cytochrome b subunit of formate dehydrogenase